MLELAFLGPLEARQAGEALELGGSRPRSLLALLALHSGSVVSLDLIVEDLWGEQAPATARHMVAVYVSRLRKTLGDDIVVTRRPGYLLQVGSDQVDAIRFERLLVEGKDSFAAGDADSAVARLGEALALWRGPALVDFAYEPFAQAEIARLEELRLQAAEERIEAELALGRGAELVAELETLVADAPLRERRRGPAHARALPLRPPGGCPLCVPGGEARLCRGPRDRAGTGPPRARAANPRAGRRAARARAALVAGRPVHAGVPENGDRCASGARRFRRPAPRIRRPVALSARSSSSMYVRPSRATAERQTSCPTDRCWPSSAARVAHEDDSRPSHSCRADELRALGVVSRGRHRDGRSTRGSERDRFLAAVVRTAARLKESAQPGEIALGESAGQLVEAALPEWSPSARGERQGLRLVEVAPDAPARPLRLDAPLVGEAGELAELRWSLRAHRRRA